MKLLKNRTSYLRWKRKLGSQDSAPEPKWFPCFAYLTGVNYGYEEDYFGYLYAEDIDKMQAQLRPAARATAKPSA